MRRTHKSILGWLILPLFLLSLPTIIAVSQALPETFKGAFWVGPKQVYYTRTREIGFDLDVLSDDGTDVTARFGYLEIQVRPFIAPYLYVRF